jgi:hypothetical protein
VFPTSTHNFGNNYPIFREIRGTMPRDSVFKTNITAEPVAMKDSLVPETFFASTLPFNNGKTPLHFPMVKIVNTPLDSHTTDWATFFAGTIAAVIS